jgi:GT2 family glycosyltransferase
LAEHGLDLKPARGNGQGGPGRSTSAKQEQHERRLTTQEAQAPSPNSPIPSLEDFDEAAYLRANPDVAAELTDGKYPSGHFHYVTIGWQEERPLFELGCEPRNRLIRTLPKLDVPLANRIQLQLTVDATLFSDGGGFMIVGWLDDSELPLDYLKVSASGWHYTFDSSALVRLRRRDVEAATGTSRAYGFGFLAFAFLGDGLDISEGCELSVGLKGMGHSETPLAPRRVPDTELRETVLSYTAQAEFFGNRQIEVFAALDRSLGKQILNLNLDITRKVLSATCVERIGQPARSPKASIIVCLYGKPEYLFLQNAMFVGCPGFDDYELIYVSNSPEMAERLLKEAAAAHQIYGLPQTIVLLAGNAGFGAANNVAVGHARSSRILIVNPDVFPRDRDWAIRHSQAVANLPPSQTRIFGVPLYYDDGSLMHGGMYFDVDRGVSLDASSVSQRQLLRVEHYGKGSPAWATRFTEPRPVPAITGAFMSMDRAWFEHLGGFNESYVFGHYEDADLCLKSIRGGTAPWIHDIRLWHLEGQGSHRRPVHEGGSLVNRWLFTTTWSEQVSDGLLGPDPTNQLMRQPSQAGTAAGAPRQTPSPPAAPAASEPVAISKPRTRASSKSHSGRHVPATGVA